MTRYLTSVVILSVGLTACGKKEAPAPPPEKVAPVKVSVDAAAPEAAPEPPPPAPAAPAAAADAPPPEPVNKGDEAAEQAKEKRYERNLKWLQELKFADPARKKQILQEIERAKLTDAQKAELEQLRIHYNVQF